MTGKPLAAKKLDNIPMEVENDPEEPLRIMLIGKSGAGKSMSGNTILNKTVFKFDMRLKRVTIYCEKEDGMVEDRRVSVIDTPGLFEEGRDKDEIVREILMRVKLQEPGPHVFVLVIPLGRMTQEDQDTKKLIEAKFGPNVWDYTIVLFTHGDRLEGKTINDVITESDNNLRDFVRKCSGGFHVFDNKHPEDQTQVTRLIEKIETLVALNGGGHYRTEFYPREEREIRKEQERILAERNGSIKSKEEALRKNVQGEELNMKMKELWRKEEESSRIEAEAISRRNMVLGLGVLFVLFLFLGWVFNGRERNGSIKSKEDDLRKNVQREELNMKMKELSRKAEESSRIAAEAIHGRNVVLGFGVLFVLLVLFLFLVWVFRQPQR